MPECRAMQRFSLRSLPTQGRVPVQVPSPGCPSPHARPAHASGCLHPSLRPSRPPPICPHGPAKLSAAWHACPSPAASVCWGSPLHRRAAACCPWRVLLPPRYASRRLLLGQAGSSGKWLQDLRAATEQMPCKPAACYAKSASPCCTIEGNSAPSSWPD